MGSVGGTGGEVHEERFVGRQGLLLSHPGDGPVRQILGEGVTLLRRLGRFDRRGALVKTRVVLVGLTADEPVEVLETRARGPLVERAGRGDLPHRHLVALAELGRRIAVELQRFRDRRLLLGSNAAVSRRRGGHLGDRPHPHGMVVTSRQHCLSGRGAQSGGVEAVEFEAICG